MARGRSGISDKVTGDVVRRFSNVRTLWLAIHNDPELTVAAVSVEFYYAIGELLEGKSLSQIEMHKINKTRVLRYARED